MPRGQTGAGSGGGLRRWVRGCAGAGLAACFGLQAAVASAPAKQPGPEIKLQLSDLGFPGVSANFLAAGASLLTIHFVDNDHLLLTYGTRGLVPRLVDDPPEDDDRMVAAELVELPSGKVVARTDWHLHDHGRYLWNLGEGRFLLRERDAFYTFAPLAGLAEGKPFERTKFPHRRGKIEAVLISHDNKLLTVETALPRAPETVLGSAAAAGMATSSAAAFGPAPPIEQPVILDFYRMEGSGAPSQPLMLKEAGSVRSAVPLNLPLDGDGYLRAADRNRGHWAVTYDEFGGKDVPLAPVDSSCPPGLKMVGTAQLVAVTCRGNTDHMLLTAYDFEKHEMWEEPMGTFPLPPTFAFAPAAGRFALSRLVSFSGSVDEQTSTVTQEVRVYQTQTGDLLLKVNSTPVMRTAENFDLSADGMRVVLVRGGALEVYRLPELTKLDQTDLADLKKVAPPPGSGPVLLRGLVEHEEKALRDGPAAATVDTAATDQSTEAPLPSAPAAPTTRVVLLGDVDEPRTKPPTLLNPGEVPEFERKAPTPK